MESPVVLPSAQVPETCAGGTSYNDLLLIQGISERMINYEKWLMNRLIEQCGESATQLEDISADIQTQLREAQDDKAECLEEFFGLYGFVEIGEYFAFCGSFPSCSFLRKGW